MQLHLEETFAYNYFLIRYAQKKVTLFIFFGNTKEWGEN